MRAQAELEKTKPKPPMVFIQSKNRSEENPNDPKYIEELLLWASGNIVRTYEILLMTGTELHSVPDSVMKADSPEFAELCEGMGIPVDKNRVRRYVQWIEFVACKSSTEFGRLRSILLNFAGTSEAEVAQALKTFRSHAQGSADPRVPAETHSADGDRNSPAV